MLQQVKKVIVENMTGSQAIKADLYLESGVLMLETKPESWSHVNHERYLGSKIYSIPEKVEEEIPKVAQIKPKKKAS